MENGANIYNTNMLHKEFDDTYLQILLFFYNFGQIQNGLT